MKYSIIFTISINICLSQNLNKNSDEITYDEKVGINLENAGNELVEYVNDSFRNSALVIVGQILLSHNINNWDKNNESIRNTAAGVLLVFAGAIGQISNVFKLKKAGKQLQQAGKLLNKMKWFFLNYNSG